MRILANAPHKPASWLLAAITVWGAVILSSSTISAQTEQFTHDFETGDLSGWQASGEAFRYQPTLGDNPTARNRRQPSRHQGKWWIGTYEKFQGREGERAGSIQGDRPKGTLTSARFTVPRGQLTFLIGGGSAFETRVELVTQAEPGDGEFDYGRVYYASGSNSETMRQVAWDLTPHEGRQAVIRIVDDSSTGWGHINADNFQFISSSRPQVAISRPPPEPAGSEIRLQQRNGEEPSPERDSEDTSAPDMGPEILKFVVERLIDDIASQNEGERQSGQNKADACESYAANARRQYMENLERRCGYRGSQWSSDYRTHLRWCMEENNYPSRVDAASERRQLLLERCAAQAGPTEPAPSTFSMPDVIGLTVPEARRRVLSAGRQSGATSARAEIVGREHNARPAGQIIRQWESPGTPMRPYQDDVGGIYGEVAFRVVVSTGPAVPATFPMPNVVGLTVPDAERLVLSAGRQSEATSARAEIVGRENSAWPAGQIIQQRESPGTPMRPYQDDVGGIYGEVAFRVVVSTGPEPAPDFVGKTLDAAELLAGQESVNLGIGAGQRDPRTPEGVVVRQDPAAGQPMPQRRVTVYPSAGYPLPNYVERPLEDARLDSRNLGFRLEEQSEDRFDIPRGVVFEQEPDAGTLLPLRGPVRVRVSSGWPVPDLIGKTESEADAIAMEIRIELNKTRQENFDVPAGVIFNQQPQAEILLPPDRTVDVWISLGYPLPDLVGMHEDEARQVASDMNFSLLMSRELLADRSAGHIDSQSPEPGARLPLDGPVSVVVSDGGPTPDFVGRPEEEANGIASASDITLVRIAPREHFELPAGLVIEQQPAAGSMIPADRQVNISLSLGWPVAPDAVGRSAGAVEQEFLARHPNAVVDLDESFLTIEPVGTVISQHPEPNVKLGPGQRLNLVSSGTKPPWFWPGAGVFAIVVALGVFAGLNTALSSSAAQEPTGTEDPGGIRLRVTKDHGIQTTDSKDGGDRDRTATGEIVRIRVHVDLGEQSAGPVDDEGDET